MSISFSGLGSGLDYSTWIDQLVEIKMQKVQTLQAQELVLKNKQTTLNTVKTSFNTLRSSLQTVSDSKFGGSMDIFASNVASSSDSKYVTATVTSSAPRQDFSVYVEQLATQTIATSTKSPGKQIDENTLYSNLANGNAKVGKFSIYVDGQKHEINIEKDDTLGQIKEKLESIDGVKVNIEDSYFTITSDKEMSLGANSDTSNFMSVMGLTSYSEEIGGYTSNHPITELKDNEKLLGKNSGFNEELTAGTFIIGNHEFEINENTTLKSLINDINNATDAGVKASFDFTSGQLILTSKSTGSMNINIEAGTSNITDVFGYTDNGKMVEGSQVAGQNAILEINGTEVISFSNTVTSDVTGLTGVTLNLNAAHKEEDYPTTVSVKQDTDKIFNQVSQVVKDLNAVISQIDTNTAVDSESQGALAYESQLVGLRNTLRQTAMSAQIMSDGTVQSLASIGITTGKVGTSVDENTNQLVIDEKKLREAIEANPEMVRELLIGSDEIGTPGVANTMLNTVTLALDSKTGYFATTNNTINSQISTIEEKIATRTRQAETYRATLEKRFKAMDAAISKLKEQFNGIDFSNL